MYHMMLIMGGHGICEDRGYMENLCIFSQFCCEPKTVLKNKVFFKKVKIKNIIINK